MVGFALAGRAALTLAHALSTAKAHKTVWQRLNGLPAYVIGVLGVCIGLLLLGLGGLQLASPGILERTAQTWIDENIGPIPTPPPLPGSSNK